MVLKLKNNKSSLALLLGFYFILALAFRCFLAGNLPLSPDEAYYANWSQRLRLCYFDHPPGVALSIWLGRLFSNFTNIDFATGPLANYASSLYETVPLANFANSQSASGPFITGQYLVDRLPALFGFGALMAIIYAWTYKFFGFLSAFYSVLAFSSASIYSIGSIIITPDVPLLFFWTLCVILALPLGDLGKGRQKLDNLDNGQQKIVDLGNGRQKNMDFGYKGGIKHIWLWLLIGLFGGAGLISKYTMALYALGLIMGLLLVKRADHLKTAGPWLGILMALMVFSPVLIWNYRNNWLSFAFQSKHAFGGGGHGLKYTMELLGGQAVGLSPFVFLIMIIMLFQETGPCFRAWKRGEINGEIRRKIMLLSFFYAPLFVFIISSFSGRVEANWPAPLWIGLFPLFGLWATKSKGHRIFAGLAIIFGALLSTLVLSHAHSGFLPISPKIDRTNELLGWPQLARRIAQLAGDPEYFLCDNPATIATNQDLSENSGYSAAQLPMIIASDHRLAGEVEYEFRNAKMLFEPIWQIEGAHRYDHWGDLSRLLGRSAIFYYEDKHLGNYDLGPYFESKGPIFNFAITKNDKIIKSYYLEIWHNYRGEMLEKPKI